MEDAVHVLFDCSIAREVWCSAGLQNVITVANNDTVMTVLKRILNAGTREQFAMVCLLCWSIWTRRNQWVWQRIQMSVFGIKAMACNVVADRRRARNQDGIGSDKRTEHCKTWTKPPADWIKINIDASYKAGETSIGVGCVVRDNNGKFIRARTNLLCGTTNSRETEAYGLKEALEWTRMWRTTRCIFESDAKLLVDAFQRDRGRSNFDTIVEICSDNLRYFENVSVVFVSSFC